MLLVYGGVIFIDQGTGEATRKDFIRIFPYALILNIWPWGSGFLIARVTRLKVINQFTISIEVGLQNSALAIFVAATLLKSNEMALVPVVYGSFTFFTTLFFGWFVKKMKWTPGIIGRDT